MAYSDDGEEIQRLFIPSEDSCSRSIPLDRLVVYNASKKISQLQMKVFAKPEPFPNSRSLVVYIDGACRKNGTADARASYGVFFGPGSPYNLYGLLPSSLPQTSTRAEIEALSQALDVICEITDGDLELSEVKIATDSSFLVNAMSTWIEQWIDRDGRGSRGSEVAHFEVLKSLHEKLNSMEFGDDGGREVQFWHIVRDMNKDADALANKAFSNE